MIKFCPGCQSNKSTSDFSKNSRKPDGLQSYCRICHRQKSSKYFYENQEKVQQKVREYGKSHLKIVVKRIKKWRIANREYYLLSERIRVSRRRALKAKNGGSHSIQEWQNLVAITGSRCLCCGKPGDANTLTRDHIVPISKGGPDSIENIQPLCQPCNNTKFVNCTRF